MADVGGLTRPAPSNVRGRTVGRGGRYHCGMSKASRAGCVLLLLLVVRPARAEDGHVRLRVDPAAVAGPVAPDFMGLGYETSAVAQPGYFSDRNDRLVRLYRNLSPHGLVRVGGNVSDHTRYDPDGVPTVAAQSGTTVITRVGLADLAGFARATGWHVMWGLNLGTGSKGMAAAEAADVARALGDRLQSFEVGNEVDALPRFHGDYAAYHAAFVDYRAAVRAAAPAAAFSGPDVIGKPSFLTGFAADEPDTRLLTRHYYRADAGQRRATLDYLLQPDAALAVHLDALRQLCADHHLPGYRINETNSYSGGGKPGVSDTFAGALWCLDYLYVLATHGAAGVNVETDVNHLAWVSHYSPVVHDAAGVCSARPEYYALLAFAMATGDGGRLLQVQPDVAGVNATAYAVRDAAGAVWVTVVNKDLAHDAAVELAVPAGATAAAYRLSAPSVDATAGVTFAGSAVADDGTWEVGRPGPVSVDAGVARLIVPHATAVVVRVWPA